MNAWSYLGIGAAIFMYFLLRIWNKQVASERLRSWAGKTKLEILRVRQADDFPGLHFKYQAGLFYVLTRDENGAEKAAWVDTGALIAEALDREVHVVWNEGEWGFRT